jgi:hypothetical protein
MRTYWTHAGLIEEKIGDDYGILESAPRGISCGLLYYHYKHDDIAIYRYRGISPRSQVKILFSAKYQGKCQYDYGIFFRVLAQEGIKGTLKLLSQLVTNKRPMTIPHTRDNKKVCSEFVQECYEDGGLPLIDSKYLLIPRDIATLRHSKLEQIFGPDKD